MLWVEKWFVNGLDTSSITVQSLGRCTARAGCRCEDVVFVTIFVFFVCYAPRLVRSS